ncbi:MAG: YgfZ/GcvT domain-containing protein [Pyrinomonadaceae bacterium]
MNGETEKAYWHIRNGGAAFYEQSRGLIAVWGREAVQFLDGMITNDMKTLADGEQMLAAFPNAQGRLLAVVRVSRQGERFLIETEGATREKVYQNLFKFTFAGDFFVEDLSDSHRYFELYKPKSSPPYEGEVAAFRGRGGSLVVVENETAPAFRNRLMADAAVAIADELYETLRIEHGIPKYGIDMDETTVVPELGLDGLISYNKGCYIGQEIIARIHFRGHVAKQLTGLVLSQPVAAGSELVTADGKSAGRITSLTYSPTLEKTIALGFVRYDNLSKDTKLLAGEAEATVVGLPFEV